MSAYRITLSDCDDETVIDIELAPAEAELLKRVATLSESASTYGCMPILRIEDEPDDDGEAVPDDPDTARDRDIAIRDGAL